MNGCAKGDESKARDLKSNPVRTLLLFVLGVVLLSQIAAFCEVPAFRAPLPDTPATPSYFRNNLSATSNGPGWSSLDPEIEELARGLKYDPGLMYKFVHDYIKFSLGWGDLKGPYMTWMDRSGNAFDQASLMIALLEEAESHCTEHTVADPNYVVGEIELDSDDVDEWLGIQDDSDKVAAILARAGIYATVVDDGSGGIDYVRMEHVWVKVKIDGDTYEFDPSFKVHEKTTSQMSSFSSAMGYIRTTFLNDASANEQSTYVDGIDEDAIRDDLDGYTDSLVEYIQNNIAGGGLMDVIGGRTIIAAEPNALPPSSLAHTDYTVESTDDEFDMASMPDMYRTTLRVQHEGIDITFNSSEVYGRRLSLQYDGSHQPQLVLDGSVKDTGNQTDEGSQYDLTLTVTHPYGTSDFDGTVTVKVTSGGFYNIVNGWGDTDTKIIEEHRGDLEQHLYDGESATSEKVMGESFAIVGYTWLAQTSKMRALAAGKQCGQPNLINHHSIGLAGQDGTPYIDMPLVHLGVYDDSDPNAIFLTVAGHAGAYEHEVIRHLQDCNSVSIVALMQKANAEATYDNIYTTDDSDWSSIQSNLQNYDANELSLVYSYINPSNGGFTVRLPQQGNLSEADWTGIGFQAVKADSSELAAAYIISGGFSGGACADDGHTINAAELFDRGDIFAGEREGTCHHDSTDLTIGTGGMPFGLSLSRTYSSQKRLKDGPLGLGWTHNFDITATTRSDSFQALGADSPIDAAAHIVALHVVYDLLTNDSDGLDDNVIASFVESWLMDKMMDNLVTIEQGGGKMHFVKLPDEEDPNGFFNPPTRKQLRLVLNNGNFRLKNPGGIFNDFNSSGQLDEWSDAHGNKVDFTYSNGKLDTVACKIGGTTTSWSMSFTYDGDHVSSVSDSASRSISYGYTNGNLTTYTNPDGNDYTYDYDDANDGQLTKVFSPVDAVNPVLTNVYDSLGRLRQQKDANDYPVDYYLAGFRAETVEPNQTNPQGQTKRYSTVVWADEFGRPISATDQLGRETTHEYDGKLRLIKSISAYGTSSEFAYDQYDRIKQKDSIVKPGSEDPNVNVKFDYGSSENQDGRWFIHRTEVTDPNNFTVYHYYDYNDVGTYGTAEGYLMKIVYPPSEAGTASVEFTYDPNNGLIQTKKDPNGIITRYEYNDVDYGATLSKVIVDCNETDGLNLTTEYTYDSVGNVKTVKDPRGAITEYDYYDSRLLKQVIADKGTGTLNITTNYEYYADGKLAKVKQQEGGGGGSGTVGNTTVFQGTTFPAERYAIPSTMSEDGTIQSIAIYHNGGSGNVLLGLYADNGSNKPGSRLGVTASTGVSASEGWQTVDLISPVNVTNGQKLWLAWVFETSPRIRYAQQPPYRVRSSETWSSGMPDPFGTSYSGDYTYSIYANYTTSGGGGGGGETIVLEHVTYNDRGMKETVRGPYADGNDLGINLTTFDYDALGRLTKVTDAENNVTETKYYPDGKVWRVIDAEDHNSVTNTYDANGYLIKVEDAKGNATQYEYNGFGGLEKTIYADGTFTEPNYSEIRETRSIQTRAGDIIETWYDHLNRVKKKVIPEGQNQYRVIKYRYDLRGRLIETYEYSPSSPKANLIKNTYDRIGRLTQVDYEGGVSVKYEYDDNGNRTKLTYPDSSYITYEYDALNRLTKIKDSSSNELAKYTYDSRSRRTKLEYVNGTRIDYTYDAANRLTTIDNTTDNDSHDYDYTYDKVGNRLTMLVNGTDTHSYTYDDIYQLTDVNYPTGYAFSYDTTFNYDDAGNRSSVIENGTISYSTNNLNQYDDVGGIGYDYDLNGNTTFDGVAYYSYDSENRLIGAVNAEGSTAGPLNAAVDNMELTFTTSGSGGGGSGPVSHWAFDEGSGSTASDSVGTNDGTIVGATWTTSGKYDDALDFDGSGDYVDLGDNPSFEGITSRTIALWFKADSYSTFDSLYADNYDYFMWREDGKLRVNYMNGSSSSRAYEISNLGVSVGQWGFYAFTSSLSGNDYEILTYKNGSLFHSYELSEGYTPGTSGFAIGERVGGNYVDGIIDDVQLFDRVLSAQEVNDLYLNGSLSGGGGAAWATARPDASDPNIGGPDSAKSGDITHGQQSYFQTTVTGPGTLKFYWKVSSESGNDLLEFRVDDTLNGTAISGEQDWAQRTPSIASGAHTLKWQYVKNGSGDSGDDCGWVDRIEWIPSGSPPAPSLAESLDTALTVTTGGDANWSGSTISPYYYGGDAARRGWISDNQQTWMQTTYTASAGDIVSFYWKVSSEQYGDYLRFEIDSSSQDSISGTDDDWQKKSYALSAGSRTLKWVYEKDSAGSAGDDCGWVDGLYVGPSSGSLPPDPEGLGAYSESLDSNLKFTSWGDSTWWTSSDFPYQYYHDGDAVQSGDADPNKQSVLQAIVESDSSDTVTFWWKVSCEWYTDFLRFYIDGTQQAFITGDEDWQEESFAVSSGIHTLKWVYEDGGGDDGENCGWVDFVQWTGPSPAPDPNNWNQIEYKYDVYGRRSEKIVDGYATRYLYNGIVVLAEYDGNNNMLRKYVHGPSGPICMIEVADSNATYYYHYDGLGSVIALSDSSGDTVQTYEYSVFGEPAVEDANHPNPYMFAGRRYDIEIGLYYNRARYYNPYTGRFLQADPIGYDDGMNLYAYCGNNSLNAVDPSGNRSVSISIPLQTVWDNASQGEYDNPDQHRADVDAYLVSAGFYDMYPDVSLEFVTYSDGYYTCQFSVPDDLDVSLDVIEIAGVPVLSVINSEDEHSPLVDSRLAEMIDAGGGFEMKFSWSWVPWVRDAVGVSLIAAGTPLKLFKDSHFFKSTHGSSIAAAIARNILKKPYWSTPYGKIEGGVISTYSLRYKMRLGAFTRAGTVGRWVPWVGAAVVAYDIARISYGLGTQIGEELMDPNGIRPWRYGIGMGTRLW